jgi:hypothetical protein
MSIQKRKSSFFWLVALIGVFVFPTFSIAATLHAILVGDTNVSDVGASVQIDQRRLQGLVKSISEYTGMTLNSHLVSGNQLSRANVEKAISSISAGSDDVIFFFWNGHGFNDEKSNSEFPTMYLGNWQNTLGLEEVANKLGQKKPRLLIVIGDTCNKPMGDSRGADIARGEKEENYKVLFSKARGTILASSSIKNQFSFGNNQAGGLYTSAFLSSLSKELAASGTPSWKTLMNRAKAPINVGEGTIQNPQSNVNVTYGGEPNGGGHDGCQVEDSRGNIQDCDAPPPKPNEGNATCVKGSYYKKAETKQECCRREGGGEKCWDDWEE